MRPGFIILNQRGSVPTGPPKMQDAQIKTVKILYVIVSTHKGPVTQILVQKGSKVTGIVYDTVVLRKWKNYYKSRHPKTGLKYLWLLNDNASAHKARIVTEFLELQVTGLPLLRRTWASATIFCFQNLNIISLERDTNWEIKKCPWICYLSVSDGCSHRRVWTMLP